MKSEIFLLKVGSYSDARIVKTSDNVEELRDFIKKYKEEWARREAVEDAGGERNYLDLPYSGWSIYSVKTGLDFEEILVLMQNHKTENYLEEIE